MIGVVNAGALLDALLKKGALTASEVNTIRVATPETELQLVVDALTRKGVLSAADLSGTSSATVVPIPAAVPAPTASSGPCPSSKLRFRNPNLRN